jgi:hypothetical protein
MSLEGAEYVECFGSRVYLVRGMCGCTKNIFKNESESDSCGVEYDNYFRYKNR